VLFRNSRWFDPESLGNWRRDSVRSVDVVSGCFLLIRRTVWDRVGGFDPEFFMYGEDADLCLRVKAAGYQCLICPDARLIHHGGASEPVRSDKMVRLFRAKAQLFEKHWSRGAAWFGKRMLACWALTRTLALGVVQLVVPSLRPSFRTWREIWRRRAAYAS
jgi:GT2 family glycosyltransferase